MIVHAVWIGDRTQYADAQLEILRSWCPDLRLHTDRSLVPEQWSEVYDSVCVVPQMKSDLIRLAALRQFGGMYLDVDVTPLVSPEAIAGHMRDTYCAIHLKPRPFIGGDILSCPTDWTGWGLVDEYVAGSVGAKSFVQFTHGLALHLMRLKACHILSDSGLFPVRPQDLTAQSLVCRGFAPPNEPSSARKVWNFAASAASHVAAGMPQASDEEIARRFAICQQCEHFDGRACRLCGCPIVRERKFISKLSWAGESCPIGKWGPSA